MNDENTLGAPWERLFKTGLVMRRALQEQQACIADVYRRLGPYLGSPIGTPPEYTVRADVVPPSFYSWRKNMFSTLFHSVYLMMDIGEANRGLYGRLIHLYRIWVTSADNLLDNEDKVVVPIDMPGHSRVMRQVVALMASDRVLAEMLGDYERNGVITPTHVMELSCESLRRLLPSAAQEATEENGIEERPDPEHVLNVIHRLKTGLLFNLAFAAPEIVEKRIATSVAASLKMALMDFGLGCQILDDVRDMARDLVERRHNFVLSMIAHNRPQLLVRLQDSKVSINDRLYLNTPEFALPAARRGLTMMRQALTQLGEAGLGCSADDSDSMARVMFSVLDLAELRDA